MSQFSKICNTLTITYAQTTNHISFWGRQVPKTTIYTMIIIALIFSNIYLLQNQRNDHTYFRDSLADTQNGFQNIFNEFDVLLEDSYLSLDEVEDLEEWVERTSILSATVTYQDKYHPDLWSGLSQQLEQFENFLEDLKLNIKLQNPINETVTLTENNLQRLTLVKTSLREYYEYIFPDDVLIADSIWMTPHYTEYDASFALLDKFDKALGEAWIIIPAISNPICDVPEVQARNILIDNVGADYFEQYFELWNLQRNTWEPEEWLTAVGYFYYIEVGNYSARREVSLFFDKTNQLLRAEAVPEEGNLMPFTVIREEAITISKAHIEKAYIEIEAEIYYKTKTHSDIRIGKYVWAVNFYHNPKNANSGTVTTVYIDPITREVYGLEEGAWQAVS